MKIGTWRLVNGNTCIFDEIDDAPLVTFHGDAGRKVYDGLVAALADRAELMAATHELVKSHEESCPKPQDCPALKHGRSALTKARARSESASDAP